MTEHLPLRSLIEEAGLSKHEIEILIVAGIVEEDMRFMALFVALQEPQTVHRPSLGLLNWLLSEPEEEYTDIWPLCRKLLDAGLLYVENRTDPRALWLLRVPPAIWDALRGHSVTQPMPGLSWQQVEDFPQLQDLILPTTLHDRILHLPDLLTRGNFTAIVLRGMHGTGRRTTLGAVARTLNRSVLLWDGGKPGDDTWPLLGPLATLYGAMPVLRYDPGPGETLDLPTLPGYSGLVGMTLGPTGGLRGPLVAHALNFNLPAPDREARRSFWQAAHLSTSPEVVDSIAARFLLTGGHIAKAAPLAQAFAVLDGRSEITTTDVQQATRALSRQALETLATALEPAQGWSDLIVNASAAQELRTLEIRCQHRELLLEQCGPAFKQSLNRGVRALFSGPSGTGKTLAACTLAAALQMDLYRVDLAAVVSKYIGETERNLNLVLSRAEELDVMLLLDEGDALMTGRTDVRSSNDRYANLETNYLLQRLENYEGIIVVTTNAGNRIDSAFSRRIDFVINFVPPEARERWLIWQCHLPQQHTVSALLLEEVASRCALTGGQIRNAALHATLLALGNADQVNDGHVETAIQREYRKAGAACPLHSKQVHKVR
jgi:ATP-dependent 26S proteasome regulatory subunit